MDLLLCRYVAVGSKTVAGKAYLGDRVQDFTYMSYMICCGKGGVWGDGVTPLECALGELKEGDNEETVLLWGQRDRKAGKVGEQDRDCYCCCCCV